MELGFLNYLQDPRVELATLYSYPFDKNRLHQIQRGKVLVCFRREAFLFSVASLIARPYRVALFNWWFEQMLLLKTVK